MKKIKYIVIVFVLLAGIEIHAMQRSFGVKLGKLNNNLLKLNTALKNNNGTRSCDIISRRKMLEQERMRIRQRLQGAMKKRKISSALSGYYSRLNEYDALAQKNLMKSVSVFKKLVNAANYSVSRNRKFVDESLLSNFTNSTQIIEKNIQELSDILQNIPEVNNAADCSILLDLLNLVKNRLETTIQELETIFEDNKANLSKILSGEWSLKQRVSTRLKNLKNTINVNLTDMINEAIDKLRACSKKQ